MKDVVKKLQNKWDKADYNYPTLRKISVRSQSSSSLRGIRQIDIEFNYPVTVICGPNGSGKSTILALSVLAFHGVPGHTPYNCLRKPKPGRNFSYYTFRDFFYRGPLDPDITGLTIEWMYGNVKDRQRPILRITKTSSKWMHYERRPPRPVDYFGLSRCIPASEMNSLKNAFSPKRPGHDAKILDDRMLQRLCEIMEVHYDEAKSYTKSKFTLRGCRAGDTSYSGFNMGSGEDSIIQILWMLERAKRGHLIAIEEIETTIHPSALKRLMKHILEIAEKKMLQIVMSTHSPIVLDQLPEKARVYVERVGHGSQHRVISEVTTAYAMGMLAQQGSHELCIYCEDRRAATLIQRWLPKDVRARVDIVPISGSSEVMKAIEWHYRLEKEGKAIAVLDGDVSEKEVSEKEQEIKNRLSERGVSPEDDIARVRLLPGSAAPEKYICKKALDHVLKLAEMCQAEENEVEECIRAVLTHSDPHRMMTEIARKMNMEGEEDKVWSDMVSAVRTEKEAKDFVDWVRSHLPG